LIKGIWDMVEVYCGDTIKHSEPQKLEIVQGVFNGYFYNCPKYRDENREEGERKCCNRISPVEYEKMIDHISKLLEDAEMNNQITNLVGYKWKKNGVMFEVTEHKNEKIKINMLNPKEIK
jgi:hypothetical protein